MADTPATAEVPSVPATDVAPTPLTPQPSAVNDSNAPPPPANHSLDEPDDDEEDELSYQKTLRSDVKADLAYRLILQIAEKDSAYAEFGKNELKKLSKVLSILSVKRGDTIIARGEEASFCAIVLDGVFQALVAPNVTVELKRGALVGEMSLFEGGRRNADILCSEDAILAVITFSELKELGTTYPILQRHLYFLFAAASIKKLRKMTQTPAQIKDEEANKPEATHTLSSSPSNASAQKKPVGSSELLYRSRIEREDDAKSAEDLEKQKMKLAKAQQNAKTDKIRLENAQRKIEKYNELLDKTEHERDSLQTELQTKQAQLTKVERLRDELKQEFTKLQATLTAESSARQTAEYRAANATSIVEQQYSSKYEPLLATAKDDLMRCKAELETNSQHLKKTTEEHLKLLEANRKMQENVGGITTVRNTLYNELFEEKKKREHLETLLQASEKTALELRAIHRANESKLVEAEERLISLNTWKNKALEMTQALEAEKRNSARAVEDALHGKVELEDDVHRYQKLLKLVVVANYVRESRLRKSLALTHEHVSDMLLTSLEENLTNSGGTPASSLPSSISTIGGSDSSSKQLSRNTSNATLSNSSNSNSSSFKAIKKRKKAYLQTLLRSKSKPREIVASLDEEVMKLKAPMVEIIEKIKHWKLTSESFFQRNIELTTEKTEIETAFRKTLAKMESIKVILRTNQQDHEELVNKNLELNKANHVLKNEVERLQSKYGMIASGSEKPPNEKGDNSNSSGESNSKSSKTPKSKSSTSPTSPSSASQHAQAIEALQLQQQEVLQQNIQRLQLYYNSLITSIQSLNQVVGVNGDGTQPLPSNPTNIGDEKQQLLPTPSQSSEVTTPLDVWTTAPQPHPQQQNHSSRSHSNSTTSLHQQQQIANLTATYTINASTPLRSYPSPSTHTNSRSNLHHGSSTTISSPSPSQIAYPSALKPVHTMHPLYGSPAPQPLMYYNTQPVPSSFASPSGHHQQQRAPIDHQRRMYQQAIHGNKKGHLHHHQQQQQPQQQQPQPHLFYLPQMPQQSYPTGSAQTQRATNSTGGGSTVLFTQKSRSTPQTSRPTTLD